MGGRGAEEEVRTKVMMTRVYVKASAEDKMERVFSWIPRELHSQPPSGKKKSNLLSQNDFNQPTDSPVTFNIDKYI